MTDDERDELLIRMDERLKALKDGDDGDIPEIKIHLANQNGRIRRLEIVMACIIIAMGGSGYGIWQLFSG